MLASGSRNGAWLLEAGELRRPRHRVTEAKPAVNRDFSGTGFKPGIKRPQHLYLGHSVTHLVAHPRGACAKLLLFPRGGIGREFLMVKTTKAASGFAAAAGGAVSPPGLSRAPGVVRPSPERSVTRSLVQSGVWKDCLNFKKGK